LVDAIKHPARFLCWGILCLTAAAGCCAWYFRTNEKRIQLISLLPVVGIATSGLYLTEQKMSEFTWNFEQGIGINPVSGVEYLIQRMEGGIDE